MEIKVVGIPSFAGALYSGTEAAPEAMRKAGLIELLKEEGIEVKDLGDIAVPSYMPRHNIAPIRNWPAPRIVWEEIDKSSYQWFGKEEFILILGGDCSIVAGTVNALHNLYGDKTHLIAIDGHLDTVKPSVDKSIGAAAMGLWFLTNENMFFNKPSEFHGRNIRVVGHHQEGEAIKDMSLYSLDYISKKGIKNAAEEILASLPSDSKVLIHLDLDVLYKEELYAVYSPSDKGMKLKELEMLLATIISDSRVVGLEVTEFSAIKDLEGSEAYKVVKLLGEALKALKRRVG